MGIRDWYAGWPLLLECGLVLVCLGLAWQRLYQLRRFDPPDGRRLLLELSDAFEAPIGAPDLAEVTRRAALAELNQRISDVAFALSVLPATFAALTRICIASGTALALVAFLQGADRPPLPRALHGAVCALSGVVGAGFSAFIGRAAKRRAIRIREAWNRRSRELGSALQASLE